MIFKKNTIIKKVCVIAFLMILTVLKSYGQWNTPYPKSIIDLGAGVGPNFGLLGIKVVAGYKGNGVLVGLGTRAGQFAQMYGFQFSGKNVFMNFCWGDYGTARPAHSSDPRDISLVRGKAIMAGGKVSLGKSNIVFLEGGLGLGFDGHFEIPYYGYIEAGSAFIFGAGLGIRIGDFTTIPDKPKTPEN